MFRLGWLADAGLADPVRLPHTVKILLEGMLRLAAAGRAEPASVLALARWPAPDPQEVPFVPARVLMQDFTGVPAVVDLAAMRSAFARAGADPRMVETVIDAPEATRRLCHNAVRREGPHHERGNARHRRRRYLHEGVER